jgi:hypothetical protein
VGGAVPAFAAGSTSVARWPVPPIARESLDGMLFVLRSGIHGELVPYELGYGSVRPCLPEQQPGAGKAEWSADPPQSVQSNEIAKVAFCIPRTLFVNSQLAISRWRS